MSFEIYMQQMQQMVQPMRDELTEAGFEELTSAEEVDTFMQNQKGTSLVVINSVCGCAAGLARPSAVESLNHDVKPEQCVTVFAGQDKEATEQMRSYFSEYPPSSPSMALVKDREVVHFIPRESIENKEAEEIVSNLTDAFEKHC